jgi:hypothetical protein
LLPEGADDVTYVQFMGKDNVAFHTVSFPVTLLGGGEPWKLVDRLKALELGKPGMAASSRPPSGAASSWTRRSTCCRRITGAGD